MAKPIIEIQNISKVYRIGSKRPRYLSLREELVGFFSAASRRARRAETEFWSLRDVSIDIHEGEVVGIIGRNGAGKSTLLKILSRITPPTKGQVIMRGRVGSLLEVGTGFHPELTGRENIYLNGTILGMTRKEITAKFDQIVSFAEIEKFLDTPVKRYSSGMYVRLAFAVAAHLDPEILLVDEVLAVGDISFQEKCLGKMGEVAQGGRTVLFVSHNMSAISNLCRRCILLNKGALICSGDTESVIANYLSTSSHLKRADLRDRADRKGDGCLRITDIFITDEHGHPVDAFITGKGGQIHMVYESDGSRELKNLSASLSLDTVMGQRVLVLANEYTGDKLKVVPKRGVIRCTIPNIALNTDLYTGTIYIVVNGILADWVIEAVDLPIYAGDFFGTGKHPDKHDGKLLLSHSWDVVTAS